MTASKQSQDGTAFPFRNASTHITGHKTESQWSHIRLLAAMINVLSYNFINILHFNVDFKLIFKT